VIIPQSAAERILGTAGLAVRDVGHLMNVAVSVQRLEASRCATWGISSASRTNESARSSPADHC